MVTSFFRTREGTILGEDAVEARGAPTISGEEVTREAIIPSPQPQPPLPPPQIQTSNPPCLAGNLSRYLSNWKLITNNNYVLNIISTGYKIQVNSSNLFLPPVISTPSKSKILPLSKEIDRHLCSGVISEVKYCESDIVSRVFSVPKASGGIRMIIDLSELNKHINKSSFRMEDKNVIKSLIKKKDFFTSIDLKDAFHSVSLHPDSRKLATFEYQGKSENSLHCICEPFKSI